MYRLWGVLTNVESQTLTTVSLPISYQLAYAVASACSANSVPAAIANATNKSFECIVNATNTEWKHTVRWIAIGA